MPDVLEQLSTYGKAVEAAIEPVATPVPRNRRPLLLAAATVVLASIGAAVWVLRADDASGPAIDTQPTDPDPPPGWRTLDPGPLHPREGSALVWTGEELVVWGGPRLQVNEDGYRDGAAYDPEAGTWRRMSPSPLPGGYAAGVWTGDEVLIWSIGADGGVESPGGWPGAAWDPETDTWRSLTPAPRAPVTGSPELLVVEGDVVVLNLGFAYDVAADEWRPLPERPVEGPVESAVWTGEEIIALVANRSDPSLPAGDAIAYALDPDEGDWRLLPPTDLREGNQLVWDGRSVLALSTYNVYREAASYRPGAPRWEPLPPLPFGLVLCDVGLARVGDEALVIHCDGTARLTPDREWAVGPPPPEPLGRVVPTGDGVVSWWSSDEHFNFEDAPVTWFQTYVPPPLDDDLAPEDAIPVNNVVLDLDDDVRLVAITFDPTIFSPGGPSLENEPQFELATPAGGCRVSTIVAERAEQHVRRATRESGVAVERWPLAVPDLGLDDVAVARIPAGGGEPAHVLLQTYVSYVLDIACPDLATAEDLLAGVHR